jgi:hypothetical protein
MLENCPNLVGDIWVKASKGLEKALQLFPATTTTIEDNLTFWIPQHVYQLQMEAGRVYAIEWQGGFVGNTGITLRLQTPAGDDVLTNSLQTMRVLTARNDGMHHLFVWGAGAKGGWAKIQYKVTIHALENGPDGRLFSGGVEIKRLDPEAGK